MSGSLLESVRRAARLSQEELAERAGTSRSTLSAYEHGRKSPTLATTERLITSAGFRLTAEPAISFREVAQPRGRSIFVPDRLWRLPVDSALEQVALPIELNWSMPGQRFNLRERRQRSRCYEVVLREGMPADLLRLIDGALLIDCWNDLVLPSTVRTAWQPLIDGEAQ